MNKFEALEILEIHQKWRKGEIDEVPYTSKQLSEAIDFGIFFLNESVMHTMAKGSDLHTQLTHIVGAVKEVVPKHHVKQERKVIDIALDVVSSYKKRLVQETKIQK